MGLIRAILYRMFERHSDEVNIAIKQREREVVALEKIAKSAERDQSK